MSVPDLKEVNSTHLAAIGHDGKDLYIRFQGGALYTYPGVPKAVYEAGLGAPSPGTWFRQSIRGQYKHRQVHG